MERDELKRRNEELNRRNEEQQKVIQDYATRFADIAAQALETATRSQYLQAASVQPNKVKSIEETQEAIMKEAEQTNKRSAWKQFLEWVKG